MKEKLIKRINIHLMSLQEGAVQCNAVQCRAKLFSLVKVKAVHSSAVQYKCTEQEYYRSDLFIKVFEIFSTVQFSAVYCSEVHRSAL